jgi:hypothetical protein
VASIPSSEHIDDESAQTLPHIDKETFKQIFRDHWDAFKKRYPRFDNDYYQTVVQKMLNCGDPEKMGYARYLCTSCGHTERIAFTCKCSFCLSCAKPYADQWVDFISRRLFPGINYRHIVLTVPDFFRTYFLRDPNLLSVLMRTAHACLRDVFSRSAKVDLDIGTVIVVQTNGRAANYHPHVHILATAGGLTPQGKWRNLSYIPFDIIHRKWQFHFLTMIRQHVSDPAIKRLIDRGWKKYPKGFVGWVDKGEVPPGGKGLATYLAKYVVSPPISVRRITRYDDSTVTYWYRDHKTGQIQHETLPVLQFIGRMVQHILPKGFQRIRYYGVHAHVRYEKMRQVIDQLRPSQTPPDPLGYRVLPRKPFAQLFEDTFGQDPLLCPQCNERMELESIHHPDYGVLKDYLKELFLSEDHDDSRLAPASRSPARRLERSNPMVQLSLPFM